MTKRLDVAPRASLLTFGVLLRRSAERSCSAQNSGRNHVEARGNQVGTTASQATLLLRREPVLSFSAG
jgi:hypothetical protein